MSWLDEARRAPRRGVEVAITRLALAAIPRLSRGGALALARNLARAALRLARRERRVALANLDFAYQGQLTPARREAILRGAFENAARTIVDVVWFSRDSAARLRQWVHLPDELLDLLRVPRPQVLVTAHLGNWEVLGQAVTLAGVPLLSVAAPLANPAVDRLFVRQRERSGQIVVPRSGAVARMLRHLHDGGKVGLLLDQNTIPAHGGVFVRFFGWPVPVSTAAAVLALRAHAEICFIYCLPRADGGYRAVCSGRILPAEFGEDRSPEAVRRLTQRITDLTEAAVRRHPDLWLWTYKRWRLVEPGWPRKLYPFYSHVPTARDLGFERPGHPFAPPRSAAPPRR